MSVHITHCALRLGDNLVHLHFLRKLAEAHEGDCFIHFAHQCYLPQLIEMVCDLPNLYVRDLETVCEAPRSAAEYWSMKPVEMDSIDAWKNAGGAWERSPFRNDYARFMLAHFNALALTMGVTSPFESPLGLLFDYPGLTRYPAEAFDVLLVNSLPQSGQAPNYSGVAMAGLAYQMKGKGLKVITTSPLQGIPCTMSAGATVTQIGSSSRFCKYVVGVATGPIWTTMNVFNTETVRARIHIVEHENVNYAPRSECARTVAEAAAMLQIQGIL